MLQGHRVVTIGLSLHEGRYCSYRDAKLGSCPGHQRRTVRQHVMLQRNYDLYSTKVSSFFLFWTSCSLVHQNQYYFHKHVVAWKDCRVYGCPSIEARRCHRNGEGRWCNRNGFCVWEDEHRGCGIGRLFILFVYVYRCLIYGIYIYTCVYVCVFFFRVCVLYV